MRNNKMKGFTLVELLVVIAILAILATVSVVGYTSYIESAYVSNDNTVVAQLNSFAGVLKADMNSELFNKEITEDNVWEATQIILDAMGAEDLKPHALDYGYSYYYNFSTKQFELIKEKDVMPYGLKVLLDVFAADEGLKPGFFDYNGARVFLVDTTGSDLANAVRGFYTFDHIEGTDKFGSFVQIVNGLDVAHNNIKNAAQNSVLVTKDGIYHGAGTLTGILFHADKDLMLMETPAITLTAVDGKVEPIVIPNNVKYYGIGAINVTVSGTASNAPVVINRYAEELASCLSEDFTNVTFVLADGKEWKIAIGAEGSSYAGTPVITTVEPSGVEYPIGGTNPMKDFDIFIANNDKSYTSIQENGLNIPTVVWHTGSVKLGLYENDIVAEDTTKPVSSKRVTWALTDENGNAKTYTGVELTEAGALSLSRVGDFYPNHTTIYVTATAVRGDAKRTFAINLSRGSDATIYVDDKAADNNAIDVLWGENAKEADGYKNSYTIGATLIGWENKESQIFTYDDDIKIVVDNTDKTDADKLTADNTNKTISTTTSILSDTTPSKDITFKVIVGGYYEEEVTVTLNLGQLLFTKVNGALNYVGTEGSEIKFSDLFQQVDTTATYNNVKLNVYYIPDAGESQSILNLDTNFKVETSNNDNAKLDGVWASVQSIGNGADESIDFNLVNSALPGHVIVVVTVDGLRASENYELTIVNGTNIREYVEANGKTGDEFTSLINFETLDSSKNNTYPLNGSVVLLNDLKMSGEVNHFIIGRGKTFYGNGFEFNIKDGRRTEEGIIYLTAGTMRDLKIVGTVYGSFAGTVADDCGSSAVRTLSETVKVNGVDTVVPAVIDNCYIANTRSPLRVSGATTVKNTVLFGGRYSNIDIVGGTVTIQGTVTTVQQKYSADGQSNVIGIGISVWFNDGKKSVAVENGATLKQYNFMDQSTSDSLPALNYSGLELIKMKDLFTAMFSDTYADYHFTNNNVKYVNSGIAALDKYMLDWDVTITKIESGICSGKYKMKIVITTPVADDEIFTIHCPANTYDFAKTETQNKADVENAKEVTVTGKELKAGVFFVTRSKKLNLTSNSRTYDFIITSPNYKTVTLSGIQNYDNPEFTYDMGIAFEGAGALMDRFHTSGIHYNQMLVDVYTPDRDNDTYKLWLEEYLAATASNFYTPENYDFNSNGTLSAFQIEE